MPKTTQPEKVRHYTDEFKGRAVELSLEPGRQVKEVAEALDLHPFMLSRWRKEYREGLLSVDLRKKRIPKPMSEAVQEKRRLAQPPVERLSLLA